MKKLILILAALTLVSCQTGQAARVGAVLGEAEDALCPLDTFRNVDATVVNIMALVPIIVWNPVCSND